MTSDAPGSGRPNLVITKDTTIKISWGLLLALLTYVGVGTVQFFELRDAERNRVNALITNINATSSQFSASTQQQLSTITSDLTYTARTLDGYKTRTDRLDESLQEIKIMRHRLDQLEQANSSHDRRTTVFESKFEEIQRKAAEHAIVMDYILRWINPATPLPDPPKKRNDTPPLRRGDTQQYENLMLGPHF